MALYKLTPEHEAQFGRWRDKWIAKALLTGEYTEAELKRIRRAMRGIYRAADLVPPEHEVIVGSPTTAAIASGIAACVWWLRANPTKHADLFGRQVNEHEIVAAIRPAYEHVMLHGVAKLRGEPATDAATDAATRAATYAATYAATDAATYAATDAATDAATYAATRAATYAATDAATYAATRAATYAATRAATYAATDAATDAATYAATYAATRAATDVDDALVRLLVLCAARGLNMYQGGNHWAGYTAYLSFFRHVAKLPLDYSKFQHFEEMASFGPRFVHEKFWIVSELPDFIHRDAENRPHCETGPYCRWRDGIALYYWHGVKVPAAWIEDKANIDPMLALNWPNVEERRCLAEILGWKRVLEQLKPRVIDTDPDPEIGQLLEVDLPDSPAERFIKVQCGTKREFVLPVPPQMKTALEANAWTYGLDEKTYKVEVRT